MKSKPSRSNSQGREQVIKEAQKTNDEDLTTLTFQVPKKLHNEFRGITGFKGEKMKDVISRFMQKYVDENR